MKIQCFIAFDERLHYFFGVRTSCNFSFNRQLIFANENRNIWLWDVRDIVFVLTEAGGSGNLETFVLSYTYKIWVKTYRERDCLTKNKHFILILCWSNRHGTLLSNGVELSNNYDRFICLPFILPQIQSSGCRLRRKKFTYNNVRVSW